MISCKAGAWIAVVLAGTVATAAAKSATGIYLTADDYKVRRLTSESVCGSPGHHVELHDIVHKPFIEVTHQGEVRRYEKSEIYGFQSCGGRDYRFVGNDEYEIGESKELSIFTHEVPARSPKDTSRALPISRLFFFSIGADGVSQQPRVSRRTRYDVSYRRRSHAVRRVPRHVQSQPACRCGVVCGSVTREGIHAGSRTIV